MTLEAGSYRTTDSFAPATEEAVAMIAKYSPIIEIMSGTGYWSSLISAAGADIVASDIKPYDNEYVIGKFFPVFKSDHKIVSEYSKRNLFICWPTLSAHPEEALELSQANHFMLIRMPGKKTPSFERKIEASWNVWERCSLPEENELVIYIRRSS